MDESSCFNGRIGRNAGMEGYVAKPFGAEELFKVKDAHCIAAGQPEGAPRQAPARQDIVNWPEALKKMGGNPGLLKTVVDIVLQEVPRLVATISKALAAGDTTAAHLAAHTLRGSIRYFGAREAVRFAAHIETLAEENNLAGAARILPFLEAETGHLLRSLSDYVHQ